MSDLIDRQQAIDALKNRWLKTRNYEGIGEDIAEECEIYLRTVPSIQFATDTNVGTKLGTNLAQLGTDLISRQAAIDAIDVLCQEHRYKIPGKGETYSQYNEAWQDALDRAEGAIFNMPPAEPKRGRWHYSDGKPARIGLSFGVVCDQCGTESEYCTNFCGECGADMRKVTE
jgi:hypothetical protein